MSAPSDDPAGVAVRHYDGVSALRRSARLVTAGGGFVLVEDARTTGPFAFADLIGHGTMADMAEYGLRGRAGWRIGVPLPVPRDLAARLPGDVRYYGIVDRIGLWAAAAVFAGVTALSLFGLSFAPALAARLVPPAIERRLGDLMVGDFGGRTCNGPGGAAALAALQARLGPAMGQADLRVVNVPIVNAVTLPGAHVLVFDGLIRGARSPDEVAGVVAHELGHVAHRDVLTALIRQLGLSVVLGGLGGQVGGYTNALLAAGYTRSAENQADGFAIDALRDAGISPLPTAQFFARLGRAEPRVRNAAVVLGYLSTHPLSTERRRRFAVSAGTAAYRPALGIGEWAALRDICKADPNVRSTELRP